MVTKILCIAFCKVENTEAICRSIAEIIDRPVYFSDIVLRAYLAEFGQREGFFGNVVESGAHSNSIELILSGAIDGAAINSTVLEKFLSQRTELDAERRVIGTIGASPIPPWVISRKLPADLRAQVRQTLLKLHLSAVGQAALERAQLAKFIFAYDRDYDPIRRMAREAERVLLA